MYLYFTWVFPFYVVALKLPASAKTPRSTLSVLEVDIDTTSPFILPHLNSPVTVRHISTQFKMICQVLWRFTHRRGLLLHPGHRHGLVEQRHRHVVATHTLLEMLELEERTKNTEGQLAADRTVSCALGTNKELYITLIHFSYLQNISPSTGRHMNN